MFYNDTMKQKLEQPKIVVISGASSGLGLAMANDWKAKGHIVVDLSRSGERHDGIDHVDCDVTSNQTVSKAYNYIKDQYGRIDVLVNNAGYGLSGAMELITEDRMQSIFDVNVSGVYRLSRRLMSLMNKGSKIINIASVCAIFPLCYRGLYCSTKSAVAMMSLSWRMELKGDIDIVTICPADIKTNFTKNREKNLVTSDRYGHRIEKAMHKIDRNDDHRMPASKVARKINKIACKKTTKPLYIIGWKMKLLAFAMRFFPLSWLMYWTEKIYGGH